MKPYHYINGKILSEDEAVISVNDLGFLRAYGVFDSIRTYHDKPFLLDDHLKRLERSARLIDLSMPRSRAEITRIIHQLLKKNSFKESAIRIYITGGETANGISHDYNKSSLVILITNFTELSDTIFDKGVKLITTDFQRAIPDAKTLDYGHVVSLQRKKEKAKAFEVLYAPGGKVRETGTSNMFIVKKGVLITPKDQVLMGITRNFVMKLAKKAGIKVQERDISLKELLAADEVFLTATNKDIVPVVQVDDTLINTKKIGPTTKLLMDLFRRAVRG